MINKNSIKKLTNLVNIYKHKDIPFYYRKKSFNFSSSLNLFSSYKIDKGTRILIDSIVNNYKKYINNDNENSKSILDLGCGYGVIGIVLTKIFDNIKVTFSDRSYLALIFTEYNAIKNNMYNYNIISSLGYINIGNKKFDMIISNIPAKAGEKPIEYFLINAYKYLNENGTVAIVVVNPRKELVEGILCNNKSIEVVFQKDTKEYSIFHYKFINDDYLHLFKEKNDIFLRENIKINIKDIILNLNTAIDIKEFNTISHSTKLAIEFIHNNKHIKKNINNILVHEPSQGHIPVFLSKLYNLNNISLLSNDLLSIEYTKKNLILNNYHKNITIYHKASIKEIEGSNYDIIVWLIQKDITTDIILAELVEIKNLLMNVNLKNFISYILFVSDSTKITIIEKNLKKIDSNMSKIIRKKHLGYSILLTKKEKC